MEPQRVDLSPLDPSRDQVGYERLIRRILAAAEPELARRAGQASPIALVAGWARPTLAAAAIIAVVALGALKTSERGQPRPTESMVETLGVPAPAADWLEDGREPTASDLVLAMERR